MPEFTIHLDDPQDTIANLRQAGGIGLADQIERQLPKAPVEEPIERWSVVEATDVDGRRSEWGLLKDSTAYPWVTVGSDGTPYWADWKHLTDPEVLRVGVGEPATPPAEAVEADEACPDCDDDPEFPDQHADGCRRIGQPAEIQSGPPWLPFPEPTPEQVGADLAQDEQAHARYYAQPGVPVEKVRRVVRDLRADAAIHGNDMRHPRVVLENRARDLEALLPKEPTS